MFFVFSKNCLSPSAEHRPLEPENLVRDFDMTKYQPFYYVAADSFADFQKKTLDYFASAALSLSPFTVEYSNLLQSIEIIDRKKT